MDGLGRLLSRLGRRALVAIAPTDGGYLPANQPVPIEDVSYLVLHGSHDGDVANFQGLRAYRRAKVAGDDYRFKARTSGGSPACSSAASWRRRSTASTDTF